MGDTPPALRCPITHGMFLDPVIASDGHTYERADIMEWMKHNTTSPMTREPLEPALVPNILILPRSFDKDSSPKDPRVTLPRMRQIVAFNNNR